MVVFRWVSLVLLALANLVVALWLLGWSSWMPLPHEVPREPARVKQELNPAALTVLSTSAGSNASNPSGTTHSGQ